jgi:hypothetical protein
MIPNFIFNCRKFGANGSAATRALEAKVRATRRKEAP